MNFHPIILILFLIVHNSWGDDIKKEETSKSESVKVEKLVENNSTNPATVPLPNICDKCNCTENTIKCTTWDPKTTFKDYKWPNKTWEVFSLEKTALVHLTPFPAVSIRKLIITGNKIQKIDVKSFINVTNLVELDLSHNEITPEILHPDAFEGNFSAESYEPLEKLKNLNLSFNLLHTLEQDTFKHTRDLKVLSIRGNSFGVIDAPTNHALSDIPLLEELDLSYCDLNSLPHHIFHSSHKYLIKLDLSGNGFTTPPLALEYAAKLKNLTMDNNPIEFIGRSNPFPELPELEELNLRNMSQLTGIGGGALSKLPNLSILRIQNCSLLTKIDENALARNNLTDTVWPPLKKLLISDNALRYLPERFVARWDKLEELDLMNNQWSCDCDNQYLIGSLIPGLGRQVMGENVKDLKCALPSEHFGKSLVSLRNRKLRCLDLYNAKPERDAAILVGIMIGLLLTIPVGMSLFFLWKRGFFFCGPQGPASFSRAFYKRTPHDEI